MVSFVPVVLLVRWLDAKMDGLSGVNKLIVLTAFHDDFFIAHSGCFFLGVVFHFTSKSSDKVVARLVLTVVTMGSY